VTSAPVRRIAGAVIASLVYAALSAPIDLVGHREGWWTYPSCVDPPHPPFVAYVGQAFEFVGCFALIGWRVARPFGARGVAVLAAVVIVGCGPARDFAVAAALPELFHMGPLPASYLADAGAWTLIVVVALSISRLVAGPLRG
jgi:hypothetical protein